MRILLVEDDHLIGDGIKAGLTRLGFTVDWFTDGSTGALAVKDTPYDAAVLDLTLPSKDGLLILRDWRQSGYALPVLVLTARDALEERVHGLHTGADDYVCKPFALVEVAARLHALVRRSHNISSALLTHGTIIMDAASHTVTHNGAAVDLSPKEFLLLEMLLLHKQQVLSKAALEEKIYSWDEEISSNSIEVHVHHLRKKLGSDCIRTVHKAGYTLGNAQATDTTTLAEQIPSSAPRS